MSELPGQNIEKIKEPIKGFLTCLGSFLILSCPIISGCTRGFPRPAGPGTVVGLEGNPTSLDPRFATGAYSERILPLLYNGLLKLDERQDLTGDLALT